MGISTPYSLSGVRIYKLTGQPRRLQSCNAEPNAAHRVIAQLENKYDVIIITQNIDDLHERGGSSFVIHEHSELTKASSTIDKDLRYNINADPINMGDTIRRKTTRKPYNGGLFFITSIRFTQIG